MDFRLVKRVFLWGEPRTFLSLIQKIGRCVRDFRELGEATLYITKAAYNQHCLEYEAEGGDDSGDPEEEQSDEEDDDMVPRPDLHHINREAAIEDDEDEDTTPVVPQKRAAPAQGGRGRKRQAKNLIETRDRKFLSAFIATAACRRIPWNVFFANKDKGILSLLFLSILLILINSQSWNYHASRCSLLR